MTRFYNSLDNSFFNYLYNQREILQQFKPTLDEYIETKIRNAREAAVQKIISLKYPYVPILNYKQKNGIITPEYGNSCIYTSTGVYGKKYQVAGNMKFYHSPEKYGFKAIAIKDMQAGDLFQEWKNGKPKHMMIFAGYDKKGTPIFHYSDGTNIPNNSSAMKRYAHYFPFRSLDALNFSNGTNHNTWSEVLETLGKAYTFIGVDDDRKLWKSEYDSLYGQPNPYPLLNY